MALVTRSIQLRRLQKLEARLIDESHLVPHTEAWLIFWIRQLGKYMAEGIGAVGPKIPWEVWYAIRDVYEEGQIASPCAPIVRDESNGERASDELKPRK